MSEWPTHAVAEIAESTVDGPFGSALKGEHYVEDPGVRVVRLANLGEGRYLNSDEAFVSAEYAQALARHSVAAGDVLVASLGDENHRPGRACLYPSEFMPGIVKADCFRVRPGQLADARFLVEALNSKNAIDQTRRLAQGVTRDRINLGQLRRVEVSLPPLDEQRRIAEILDTLDETIQATERVIAKRRLLRTALIREQVLPNRCLGDGPALPAGWTDVRIGDALQQHVEPVRIDDRRPYDLISIRRRHGGMFHRESLLGSRILGKNMQRVVPGTFVIARRQIVHGACAVATPEFAQSVMSMSYSAFVGTSICDPRYFFALAQTPPMVSRFWDASHGVVIEKLNFQQEEWLGYTVQLPPMEVQRQVVGALNASEAEIAALVRELEALRSTRIGLAADLLSGRVRTVAA